MPLCHAHKASEEELSLDIEGLLSLRTLPLMNFTSLESESGGRFVFDMYSLFRTTLLKLLSVRRTRKLYSCATQEQVVAKGTLLKTSALNCISLEKSSSS